jgi:hypothetical protein
VTVVIGLLNGTFLAAHITMLTAEVNFVAARRLWPRSFSLIIEQPPTPADGRTQTAGKGRERRQDESVTVDFPTTRGTDQRLQLRGRR